MLAMKLSANGARSLDKNIPIESGRAVDLWETLGIWMKSS